MREVHSSKHRVIDECWVGDGGEYRGVSSRREEDDSSKRKAISCGRYHHHHDVHTAFPKRARSAASPANLLVYA